MSGSSPIDPALALVVACCRWPDGVDRRTAVSLAAARVEDWGAVRALAAAHRVEGLVCQGLAVAGISLSGHMELWREEAAERICNGALLQVRDTLRIAAAFDQSGIPFRVLKGVPLGAAAYGTVSLKHSWDIDVLVDPQQAVAAAEVLTALGYTCAKPPRRLDATEFARWSKVAKDAEFQSGAAEPVELHWRLLDVPLRLAGLDVHGEERRVALLGNFTVPTFADVPNLAYLAAHGAVAGWSRLKWIADFSALLAAQPDAAAAIAAARRCRPGVALDQALLLRDRLFATGLPDGWRDEPRVRRLAALAMTVIGACSPLRPIERDPQAQRAIARGRWLLQPGPAYAAAFTLVRLRGTEDRRAIALPRGLHWVYWILRPLTLARRVIGRRRSSAEA